MNGRPRRPAYARERDAETVGGTRGCGGCSPVRVARYADVRCAGQQDVRAGRREMVRGAGVVGPGPGPGRGCRHRAVAVGRRGRADVGAEGVVGGAGAGGPVAVQGRLMGAWRGRGGGRHTGERPGGKRGSGGCGGAADDGEDGEQDGDDELPGLPRAAATCRGTRSWPRGRVPRGRAREGVTALGRAGPVPCRPSPAGPVPRRHR